LEIENEQQANHRAVDFFRRASQFITLDECLVDELAPDLIRGADYVSKEGFALINGMKNERVRKGFERGSSDFFRIRSRLMSEREAVETVENKQHDRLCLEISFVSPCRLEQSRATLLPNDATESTEIASEPKPFACH
jgi:hypothetical protein